MSNVTHAFVSTKLDGVDDTLIRPSDWNAEHDVEIVLPMPRQVATPPAAGSGTTIVGTFAITPLSSSIFFATIVSVSTSAPSVSSISQTNVTWTSLKTVTNGTTAKVEVWKGVASGTPGTGVTVNFSGTIAAATATMTEWPATLGLAGTLDQSADNTGSGTSQATGNITQTTANNLSFIVMGVASGATEIGHRISPYPYVVIDLAGGGFECHAWLFGGVGVLHGYVRTQANAVWANTIVSII